MGIRLSASKLNRNGLIFDVGKVEQKLQSSRLAMSRCNIELYDRGYSRSPSDLDEKELLRALIEEYGRLATVLLQQPLSGNADLSTSRLRIAQYLTTNEDFRGVLDIVYRYKSYEEEIQVLESLCGLPRFRGVEFYNLIPKYSIAADISTRCGVPLLTMGLRLLDVLYTQGNLEIIDFRGEIHRTLARYCGLDMVDYDTRVQEDASVFMRGLSYSKELEFIDTIIVGEFIPTKLGAKVISTMMKHYKMMATDKGRGMSNFPITIYRESFDARDRKSDTIGGSYEVFLCNHYMVVSDMPFSTPSQTERQVSLFPRGIHTLSLGSFVLDWVEGVELPRINNLLGIEGEFISRKECVNRGYTFTGAPTILKVLRSSRGVCQFKDVHYYRLSSVRDALGDPLKPLIGSRFELTFTTREKALSKVSRGGERDVGQYILSRIDTRYTPNSISISTFNSIVLNFVYAYLMIDCGERSYELNVSLDSVSEEDIFEASVEAERIYESLDLM